MDRKQLIVYARIFQAGAYLGEFRLSFFLFLPKTCSWQLLRLQALSNISLRSCFFYSRKHHSETLLLLWWKRALENTCRRIQKRTATASVSSLVWEKNQFSCGLFWFWVYLSSFTQTARTPLWSNTLKACISVPWILLNFSLQVLSMVDMAKSKGKRKCLNFCSMLNFIFYCATPIRIFIKPSSMSASL